MKKDEFDRLIKIQQRIDMLKIAKEYFESYMAQKYFCLKVDVQVIGVATSFPFNVIGGDQDDSMNKEDIDFIISGFDKRIAELEKKFET